MFKPFTGQSRGQALVEYGLILLITLFAAAVIWAAQEATENAMEGTISGHASNMNPKPHEIKTPDPVKPEDIIHTPEENYGGEFTFRPIAYFSIQNPVYVGDKVHYWDSSYDPDGYIVEREWHGKVESFSSEGTYTISLTVTDNDGMQDTYTLTVNVVKREQYTRIIHDQANEQRTVVQRSPVRVTNETRRIIDHVFEPRRDRYGVDHAVIMFNYHEHVVEKARDITYQVRVPLVEVTYGYDGREVSRKPYVVNGVPQYVTRTEVQTVPETSDIDVKWVENTWTFYIYDEISSVRNSNGSWGDNPPDIDFTRLRSGEVTTQEPSKPTSRDSKKRNAYNRGHDAKSTRCPTCTIPNEFTKRSQVEYDYRNVDACAGRAPNLRTHSRTHNWIDHRAYDIRYKYTGKGVSLGNTPNGTQEKILRASWKTEGWQEAEQRGATGSIEVRNRYTDCSGSGSNCWKELTNTATYEDEWEHYDTKKEMETRTRSGRKEERECTINYYRKNNWSCTWRGTKLINQTSKRDYDESKNCGPWRSA